MTPSDTIDSSPNYASPHGHPSALGEAILTSFLLFPKLSPEIQHMVFKESMCGPRIIKIEPYHSGSDNIIRFRTLHPPSALLSACQASRAAFISTHTTCITSEGSDRTIRLDGSFDTVVLTRKYPEFPLRVELQEIPGEGTELGTKRLYYNSVSPNCFSKVKHLAIAVQSPFNLDIGWMALVAGFAGLKSLVLLGGFTETTLGGHVGEIPELYRLRSMEEYSSSYDSVAVIRHSLGQQNLVVGGFSSFAERVSRFIRPVGGLPFRVPKYINLATIRTTGWIGPQ